MNSRRVVAWLCTIYLAAILVITLVFDLPILWWLIVAVLTPFIAVLYLRLRERFYRRFVGLEGLTRHIEGEQWVWQQFEKEWIGRPVRLREDVRNTHEPEDRQVYVRAGTVGTIVALRRNEEAPFEVLFPSFPYNVAVRLEKLDVRPTDNLIEAYDAA